MAEDAERDENWDQIREWGERKSELMETLLGPMHETVMHAIIPYSVGGALDLYYFPNDVPGTGIATMELSELPGEGSSNDCFRNYELVMFTRETLDLDVAKDASTPFGSFHSTAHWILNAIAPFSAEASLNPFETCEFPPDMDHIGGKCLVFDGYKCDDVEVEHDFGLLLLIEVFRSEMEYARENGGAALIERLKLAGHYPYSDLEREPVA